MSFLKNLFKIKGIKEQLSVKIDSEEQTTPTAETTIESSNLHGIRSEIVVTAEIKDAINYKDLPPYEPSLDLRDYNYPTINLFNDETRKFIIDFKEKKGNSLIPVMWSVNDRQLLCKDLSELKNLFICGSQETGKTSFLNQLIISLLLTKHPSQLKLIIAGIKPLELNIYRLIEKHFLAKLPGEEEAIIQQPLKLQHSLNAVCIEMDNRYDLLKDAGTRNITEYNHKFIERKLNPQKGHQFLPFIVLLIDDLPGFALYGKELIQPQLEKIITNGYKVGIFTCLSSNLFNGYSISHALLQLIEQRVVFNLYDKDDYKKFFNTGRINKHLTTGEFLFNEGAMVRNATAISFEFTEIEKIVESISNQRGYPQAFLLPEYVDESELSARDFDLNDLDPLFEDAARLIVQNQIGSTSLLQRRMKLGYNRTGRLMDQLEAAGIVGPNQGSKAREVLIKTELELNEFMRTFLS